MIATDYIESRKILSPELEGLRVDRSCASAITHLGLYAHTYHKDIIACYQDFKGAFPSVDHDQIVRTLSFLGLPEYFANIIGNLYSGAAS